MNNEEFRRLLLAGSSANASGSQASTSYAGSRASNTPALGSRKRTNLPMAPRVTQVDVTRRKARDRQHRPAHAEPSLHVVQENLEGPTLDERVKALEEAKKLGQIDDDTFRSQLSQLGVGGDASSTHLVKGLDWELLRRVKAGEDINTRANDSSPPALTEPESQSEGKEDFDRVMEEKEKQEIVPAAREHITKKGVLALPPPSAPTKMTRDEILRQFKANRAASIASTKTGSPSSRLEPTLGSRFKKLGSKDERKRWIEEDNAGRRREVLLMTGPDGKTKRKVRWLDNTSPSKRQKAAGLLRIDKNAEVLGMEVPAEAFARAATEAKDDIDEDIFADAGRDYDPLADIDKDGSSDEDAADRKSADKAAATGALDATELGQRRDYFATATAVVADEKDRSNILLKDPTFLAAVKKAAAIRHADDTADVDIDGEVDGETMARRKRFLEEARRREELDAIDIDMGFGGSRFDDDDEDVPVMDEKSGNKRKRGPKKRKQDKNSAGDVLKALEGRREAKARGK